MSDLRAVIDASRMPAELLSRPVEGVALFLWSLGGLRRLLPASQIALVLTDATILAMGASRGLHALGPRDATGAMSVDPARPFFTNDTLQAALDQGAPSLAVHQRSPIEQLKVENEASLALIQAVARGLGPGDPHTAGIGRLRLPLTTEIRAVVSDVDGVLTDGRIIFGDDEHAGRAFFTHDGMGTRMLQTAGIKVGWLSATSSGASIHRRAAQTGVEFVDTGQGDKGPRFTELCGRMGVEPANTLFVGDDVNDLPAMARAGLSACPADARPEVKSTVDLVLEARGGRGAFREVADIVLAGAALTD